MKRFSHLGLFRGLFIGVLGGLGGAVGLSIAQVPFTQDATIGRLGVLSNQLAQLGLGVFVTSQLLMLLGFALFEAGGNRAGNLLSAFSKLLFALAIVGIALPMSMEALVAHAASLATADTRLQLQLGLSLGLAIVAVAASGRLKLRSFCLLSLLLSLALYPLLWLLAAGLEPMLSLSRATLFAALSHPASGHLLGGMAAWGVVLVLGARHGRFATPRYPFAPANMAWLGIGGAFIYLGTAGQLVHEAFAGMLNEGGSTAINVTLQQLSLCTSLTMLAATLVMLIAWQRVDISLVINAAVAAPVMLLSAHLVGAPLEGATLWLGSSMLGALLILLVRLLDRLHVDDPIGVVSVHGLVSLLSLSVWGMHAGNHALSLMLLAAAGVALLCGIVFSVMVRGLVGLRLSPEHEWQGMDTSFGDYHLDYTSEG